MVKRDNRVINIGIGIIAILFITLMILKINNKEPDYSEMTEDEVSIAIDEKINEIKVESLAEVDEGDRMEHYVADFMEKIDSEKYEDAYNVLYGEFKNNFFPTLASFEEYAKNKFPKLMTLEHTNIERNGDIYVIWTTVYDFMKSKDAGMEMNFVVKENNLNDYVISFSII